jgi:hypothetical protein
LEGGVEGKQESKPVESSIGQLLVGLLVAERIKRMRYAKNTQSKEEEIAIVPACAVGLGNGCTEEEYRVD